MTTCCLNSKVTERPKNDKVPRKARASTQMRVVFQDEIIASILDQIICMSAYFFVELSSNKPRIRLEGPGLKARLDFNQSNSQAHLGLSLTSSISLF